MDVPHEALLLRIYTSSADKHGSSSLFVAIVNEARANGLAGATVLRGPLGFGHTKRMHETHLAPWSDDHPVIIEIVDSEAKIEAFLPILDEMMQSGLVTIERARVLQYGRKKSGLFDRVRQQFGFRACPTIIPLFSGVGQALRLCFARQLCRRADALICRRCLSTAAVTAQ